MEELSTDFFDNSVNRKQLSKKIAQFGCFRVGYENDDVAGFVGYYANDILDKTGYLSTIVVSQKYQGKGIGRILLLKCLDDCRRKGMIRCRLEVRKENLRAIRFYKAKGFEKETAASPTTDYYTCVL